MFARAWGAAARTLSVAIAGSLMVASIMPPGAMAATTLTSTGPATISGKIAFTGAHDYSSDAQVSAVAYEYVAPDPAAPATKVWDIVASTDVNADGTYSITLPDGTADTGDTFKVAFFDASNAYKDLYYQAQTSVSAATSITVTPGQQVTSINDTMTAADEYVIGGTVHFTGETAPANGVGVTVYSLDASGVATPVLTRRTNADGTYRIHLPGVSVANGYTGTYRLGFSDFDDVFAPIFYNQAATVDAGTNVVVNTAGTIVSGVDATMTAQSSSFMYSSNIFTLANRLSQRFEEGSNAPIVIANAGAWQDIMVAGPLAHSLSGSLLVTGKTLPASVLAEIARLAPTQVVIVGGPNTVSIDQEIQLRAAGVPLVRRLYGKTAAQTAVQVADEMVNNGSASEGAGLICAFAPQEKPGPSVAAAATAFGIDAPILFVGKSAMPAPTAGFISRHTPDTSLVFGGTKYVSSSVLSKIPNRVTFASSVDAGVGTRASAWGIANQGLAPRIVGLVSSAKPCDALIADTYLASKRITAVQSAAGSLDPATALYLNAHKATFARVIAIGTSKAFAGSTYRAAFNAVK